MDERSFPTTAATPATSRRGPSGNDVVGRSSTPCPMVADTMRRVHAALRAGTPPSYEALLAFGTPDPR